MAVIYTPHFAQFFDDNGNPLAGGKLYTYAAGTTTPKATYTTAAGDVENTNPVILDAAGRSVLFLDGSYKFTLKNSSDVLIKTTDNITSFTATGEAASSFFQAFSGDTSTTVFTLSEDLGTDEKLIMVFVDAGAGKGFDVLPPSSYTVSGTSLTFGAAPATGTNNIQVWAPSKLAAAASSSAAAAASSAGNAATSEANAAASELAAATSKTNAATSAANAATSEANAAASESAAATSETNAAASALAAQVAKIDWKGAWSAGTYYARDAVAHNGSSWIVKTTSASTVQEPSLEASDWELLASKGTDGTGTGDVVSTVTASIDGEIVLFNSTTGKSVKRGNTLSGIAKLTSGVVSAATAGTDFSAGTAALATGILKSTTSTGTLSIAAAADIPNPTTTRGDIIYRNDTGWTRLAAGKAGYVLTMGAADPAWAAPAIQGSRVLIATKEASASASITFTEFTSSYDIYEILWIGHLAATKDTYLNMHFSVDGGSNWLASGIYWDCFGMNGAVNVSGNDAAVMTLMDTGSFKQTNSAGYLGSGTATIMNINSTSAVNVIGANVYWNSTSDIQRVSFGGSVKTTSAINAIKFQESSGDIASGKFYLYGVRTS